MDLDPGFRAMLLGGSAREKRDKVSENQRLSDTERAIIQKTSYCWENEAVPEYTPRFTQSFFTGLREPFHTEAISNLGDLRTIPLEVIFNIIREMNIEACFSFRRVNRLACQIVTNSLEYRELATFGLDFLSRMVSTDLAKHFNIRDAHSLLRQPECSECGEFGLTISLPQMRRYCLFCELQPMVAVSALAKKIRMSPKKVCSIVPSLRANERQFSWDAGRRRIRVLSFEEAMLRLDEYLTGVDKDALKESLFRHWSDSPFTRIPYLEPTGYCQFGYTCKGCPFSFTMSSKLYTTEGFLKHFESCYGAKRIWETGSLDGWRPLTMF